MGRVVDLPSLDATHQFGKEMAEKLPSNSILALFGPLGAGKTSFVQGVALGLNISSDIQSPTFTYLHPYFEGTLPLYHFDLYRMKKPEDFFSMGFQEYFDAGGITAIEWPEKLESALPPQAICLYFSYKNRARKVEWDS